MSDDEIRPALAIGDWRVGWVEVPAPFDIEGWSSTWFRHPQMGGMYGLAAWKRVEESTFYQRLLVSEELLETHGTRLLHDQLEQALSAAGLPPRETER